MHLLWVKTELLHPIDKGGRIRTYNMLRALKKQHRITYVTLDNGEAAPEAESLATEYCHDLIRVPFREAPRGSPRFWMELLANVVSPLPYAVAKYHSPRMRTEIVDAVRQRGIDVVVCDFLFPSQNVPDGLPCRTVLFQHNVEAAIWKRHAAVKTNPLARAYFAEQWRRMKHFEGRECRRFGSVVAVSRADAAELEREYGIRGVGDVPTGVDTEFFRPSGNAARHPHEVVFTGSMDWMPNGDGITWFADDILPRIHRVMPDVTLTVVGRNPPPAIQALVARDSRLRVTGTVPDVRPYMDQASVFVVPLRVGGGTRLKIYEAMAMECPLVATTIGAEGLPVEQSRHLMIADGADAFANAVLELLQDPGRARAMGLTAAEWVRNNYGWERAAEEFGRLLENTG
ncbi:MAG TPA: glycosyltransferase [Gemmatimonadaceae bacterium]|nr:glycosyltransferase [Gemmatimonadaceae bacterium]